jgi:predicted metal-dependent phosphoesterase TrpH
MICFALHLESLRYYISRLKLIYDLCRLAFEQGIDGVALTEHDVWWPENELAALRTRYPELVIFDGMERSCREGHFLLFLPSGENDRTQLPVTIYELAPWAHAKGGMLIWAHPFRYGGRTTPPWVSELPIDGIEIASSNMDLRISEMACKVADDFNLLRFTNSDAHSADSPGSYLNDFDADLRTIDQVIRYVKSLIRF